MPGSSNRNRAERQTAYFAGSTTVASPSATCNWFRQYSHWLSRAGWAMEACRVRDNTHCQQYTQDLDSTEGDARTGNNQMPSSLAMSHKRTKRTGVGHGAGPQELEGMNKPLGHHLVPMDRALFRNIDVSIRLLLFRHPTSHLIVCSMVDKIRILFPDPIAN